MSCLSKGLCTAVSNAASGVRLSHSDEVGGEISSNKLINKSDNMLGHLWMAMARSVNNPRSNLGK